LEEKFQAEGMEQRHRAKRVQGVAGILGACRVDEPGKVGRGQVVGAWKVRKEESGFYFVCSGRGF